MRHKPLTSKQVAESDKETKMWLLRSRYRLYKRKVEKLLKSYPQA